MEHSLPVEHEANENEMSPQGSAENVSEKSSADNISNNNAKEEAVSKSRMSILSPSRLSTMFDPTILSTWITGTDQQAKAQKRTTRILDNTLKVGLESIRFSTGSDIPLLIEDAEVDDAFESLLDEMNIHGHHRNKMLEMSEDHKRTLIIQNRQAQAIRKSQQQDKTAHEEEKAHDLDHKDIMEYNEDA
ncbi:1906_t:CDS:2, partial [Acaulospora morrowiae]